MNCTPRMHKVVDIVLRLVNLTAHWSAKLTNEEARIDESVRGNYELVCSPAFIVSLVIEKLSSSGRLLTDSFCTL